MITLLLGIEHDELFWEATDTLMYGRLSGAARGRDPAGRRDLYAFMEREIERRRAAPGDDLISLLMTGDVDGRPYTRGRGPRPVRFMLIAGLENTAFGIRATLRHLAVHPEHLAAVVADPAAVTNLVEQSLRLYAPVTALARTATCDTEVAGQTIHAGERILLLFGSANRDAAVFDDPDEFHLDRRDGRHLAFGIGPHRCIGSHLARLEVRIAVEEFIRRVPSFRLAPGPDPGWYQAGSAARGVGSGDRQGGVVKVAIDSRDVRRARTVLRHLSLGVRQRRVRLCGAGDGGRDGAAGRRGRRAPGRRVVSRAGAVGGRGPFLTTTEA